MTQDKRVALILSGGGARGAYEVGVLGYIYDHFAHVRRRQPIVDFILGTSVGAINGCFIASHLTEPAVGVRRLSNLWSDIHMEEVLGFGLSQVASLPRMLLGGGRQSKGLFDVSPMVRLVEREVPWRGIARAFRDKKLQALSVSTTEVSSGRTVLFIQTSPETAHPKLDALRTLVRPARLGPVHALASAAIPILFPPVRVGSELHMDGGVRQNTPVVPALALGATHVLAIGLSTDLAPEAPVPPRVEGLVPNVAFIIGKIMNAMLLDHVASDMHALERQNRFIEQGVSAFGPEFLDKLNAVAPTRSPLRPCKTLVIRPSTDVGKIAESFIRSGRLRGGVGLSRALSLLDVGEAREADLASYVLFDGSFARRLIELGRSDAEMHRDAISAFFDDRESVA